MGTHILRETNAKSDERPARRRRRVLEEYRRELLSYVSREFPAILNAILMATHAVVLQVIQRRRGEQVVDRVRDLVKVLPPTSQRLLSRRQHARIVRESRRDRAHEKDYRSEALVPCVQAIRNGSFEGGAVE